MFSTTALTISGAGCGSVTIQAPSSPGRLALAIEISGVLVSRATAAMASAPGEPAVPMITSTLSSSIILRALRAAVRRVGGVVELHQLHLAAVDLGLVGQRGLHALLVRECRARTPARTAR